MFLHAFKIGFASRNCHFHDFNLFNSRTSISSQCFAIKHSQSKVFLYLWFVASDNEETQKKGIILVAWPRLQEHKVNTSRFVPERSVPYWWKNFIESVPVRICAFHLCIKNGGQFFKIVLTAIGVVLKKERIRMKIHAGTPLSRAHLLFLLRIKSNG